VTRPLVLAAVAAVAAIALLVACPPQNLPQPVPPAPSPEPGYQPPGDPGPGSGPNPGSGNPAEGAAGAACNVAADCASGVCEGEGCGAMQGACAAEQRSCTLDLRPYCGCDGVTFDASSSCPQRRFSHRGACATSGAADGTPCLQDSNCASGICEGKGCGDDTPGKCASKARGCTRDRRTYCGCDGVTFYGSGSCPGKRYLDAGACPAK